MKKVFLMLAAVVLCASCEKAAYNEVADEEGFEYPTINIEKCICCYKCINSCPNKDRNRKDLL